MQTVNDFDMFDELPLEAGHDDDFSVEDFLKQLEAKEKDLHISSDLDIEIECSDFDAVPDFIMDDLAAETTREVEPHVAGSAETVSAAEVQRLENELVKLQGELIRKEAARFETAEMLKRRQTDFENLKKRVERDKEDAYLETVASVVKELLPVLDNMTHALNFAAPIVDGRSADFRQFHEGIELVNRQIAEVLRGMGVVEIPAVGEAFDPTVHEAVAVEASTDFAPNVVMEELRRGYRVGERIIRASMVKVASAPREEAFNFETVDELADEDILDIGNENPYSGN